MLKYDGWTNPTDTKVSPNLFISLHNNILRSFWLVFVLCRLLQTEKAFICDVIVVQKSPQYKNKSKRIQNNIVETTCLSLLCKQEVDLPVTVNLLIVASTVASGEV